MKKILIIYLVFLLLINCKRDSTINLNSEDQIKNQKDFWINKYGDVDSTEIGIHDFVSATECRVCHSEYVEEWENSMHAHSFTDPIFQKGWHDAQIDYPNTGEKFCIQCHAPTAYVTGENANFITNSNNIIHEGITCSFCHSFTGISETVNADESIAANAFYKINPGENIMYGSIKNPQDNNYHLSEYSPIYSRSNICLPCHDFTIRGLEAEITFSEWNLATAGGMHESKSCQSCHMPLENGRHKHEFIGVDLDLTKNMNQQAERIQKITRLLETAVELNFFDSPYLISSETNDSLLVPIVVTSLIEHDLPSGTSFSREAWIEISIIQEGDTLFDSGKISGSDVELDLSDKNLLLFTSYILDENRDTLFSITKTKFYYPHLLSALTTKNWTYIFIDEEKNIDMEVPVNIVIRMLFRSFKPQILKFDHPELLDNLPIYEMARIDTVLYLD